MTNVTSCNCIGPQNGEPLCPCMMRSRKIFKRGDEWIEPEHIIGDVLEKKESGFEPLDEGVTCTHFEHNPPMHLYVPPDQQYRHVCPGCGKQTVIRGSNVKFGIDSEFSK